MKELRSKRKWSSKSYLRLCCLLQKDMKVTWLCGIYVVTLMMQCYLEILWYAHILISIEVLFLIYVCICRQIHTSGHPYVEYMWLYFTCISCCSFFLPFFPWDFARFFLLPLMWVNIRISCGCSLLLPMLQLEEACNILYSKSNLFVMLF